MSSGQGTLTLAFELDALYAVNDPLAVFEDARRWSQYVGVVSDKPTYVVTSFSRKHRIRQDFFSGPRGKAESLESVKNQFETDRHVLVGVDDADRELAERLGWEYLPVADAAVKANWDMVTESPEEPPVVDDSRDDWP